MTASDDEVVKASQNIWEFSESVLRMPLYDWQAKALVPIMQARGLNAKRIKVSVLAPNGAGKSQRIVATAALWWLTVHSRGKVVITSKDSKQLNEQVVPAIKAHLPKFQWHAVESPYFKVTSPTGGTIHAFVTDEPERMEGWHKEDDIDGPLLTILDEAKAIIPGIFQANDRCTYNATMYTSTGGLMLGPFYDSQTRNRASFTCVSAGLKDCPHIPKDKIDDIIATYGETHPFTRSSIYGEFMEQDEANRYIVALSSLERCIANPPPFRAGLRVAFCDFAAGGDENAIAMRDGNRVSLEAHWREKDKRAGVYEFQKHFRRLHLKPEEIWGDAAAKDMLEMLAEAGWPIRAKNFGDRNCSDQYQSWGAQAWLELAISIEKCEVLLPNDDKLKAQLTSRQKKFASSGKLGIEEKWFLRERNIPSPDRADAVAGAWAVYDHTAVTKTPFKLTPGAITRQQEVFEQAELVDVLGASV